MREIRREILDEQGGSDMRTPHFCFYIFYLSLPTVEDFHKRNCNRGRDIACPTSFLS